ncbi:MAG TPA: hypothetical protein EYP36_06315 [Calditrichaeota bacterium]|nr:hypothetical protein [Calditrichota bacterium]
MKTKLIQAMSRLIAILLIVILTSCEEDKLESVSRVTVSQGTYVGIIHLDWPPVSDAGHYNIERMGPDGQWIGAGTVNQPPFDDYGFGLPDNKLVEGNRYVYRIISGSDDLEDSPYSDISDEGWIYQFQPIDFKAIRQDDGKVLLSWTDTNQTLINQSNLESCRYRIQRRYENETSFTDIKTTDVTTNVANSYLDNSVSQDKKAFYKIEGFYTYRYKNMDYGMYTNTYSKKYDEVKESGGITQVDYNITQLGDFPNANDGYGFVLLKNINNTIYAATIPKPVFGSPIIYELNGTSWQNISSSYPSGLQQNFDKISIGGDGTNLWVGGVSDSAYIYSYQSGWSDNLAKNNLG